MHMLLMRFEQGRESRVPMTHMPKLVLGPG